MSKLIPEEIQVGPYTIKVVHRDLIFVDGTQCMGSYSPEKFEITLEKTRPHQQNVETFVHEVLEAIRATYSLQLPHDELSVLSAGLTQALQPIWKEG